MFILKDLEFKALLNSITISFFVSFFTVGIACFLVYYFTFYKITGKKSLSLLMFMPLFVPPYLIAFSWMHVLQFFGDRLLFGLNWQSIRILRTIPGSIFLLTLSYVPIPYFLLSQALHNIPGNLLSAAQVYAAPRKVMKRIILGMVLPSILVSFLLTFIITFITFDVPAFLNIRVFLTEIFTLYTFSVEWERAIYLSGIPVFFTGIIWSLILFIYMKKQTFFTIRTVVQTVFIEQKISRVGNIIIICSVLLLIFLSFAPIIFLHIKGAFFEKIIYDTESSWSALGNTFAIGLVGSTFLLLFSILVYLFIYRYSFGRLLFLSLNILPPITFGIMFIQLLNRDSFNFFYSTPFILILAYCFRFAPLISEVIYANSRHINKQLIEAAYIVNISYLRLIRKIIFPLYKPTLFLVWILSFWFIVTELPITLLIQPAGFQTVMSRLFILLHYGAIEKLSELTLTLVLFSLLPIIALKLFLNIEKRYE